MSALTGSPIYSRGAQLSPRRTVVIVGLDKDAAVAAPSPDQADAILKKTGAPAT
jgi:hypothetical protein